LELHAQSKLLSTSQLPFTTENFPVVTHPTCLLLHLPLYLSSVNTSSKAASSSSSSSISIASLSSSSVQFPMHFGRLCPIEPLTPATPSSSNIWSCNTFARVLFASMLSPGVVRQPSSAMQSLACSAGSALFTYAFAKQDLQTRTANISGAATIAKRVSVR